MSDPLVNGYPVLAEFRTPADRATRPGRIVLVERQGYFDPYVTGWQGDGDAGWWAGHYFTDRVEAEVDFAKRCKRGY